MFFFIPPFSPHFTISIASNIQRYAAPSPYSLLPSSGRKPLSDTLDIPEFYPLMSSDPAVQLSAADEEILTTLNTCNGYYEPVVVEVL